MHESLDRARALIGDGYVDDAIAILRDIASGQSRTAGSLGHRIRELRNEIALHSSVARTLATERRQGVTAPDELARRAAQLSHSLLGFIDELDSALARSQEPPPAVTEPVDIAPPDESRLEKVWGRNTLQSLSWLHKGLAASRAVCRVVAPGSLGTGFLVSGGQVLTNNHVVADAKSAARAVVEFNFEEDVDGRMRNITSYEIDSSPDGFLTSESLDCSVLKVAQTESGPPISSWGALDLLDETGVEIEAGAHVSIIQHPSGGQKKIAVTANEVVNVYEHRLQYMTDTMPGSSGSPVFNDDWKVVAIHRAGGNLVKNSHGDRFFANEGVLFRHILAVSEFRARLML